MVSEAELSAVTVLSVLPLLPQAVKSETAITNDIAEHNNFLKFILVSP